MKKLIIALVLFLQFCLLFTLIFYFNQKGVTWSDLAKGGDLQALRTTAGGETASKINTTLNDFFAEIKSTLTEPQYAVKQIVNNKDICILEISIVDNKSPTLHKNIYELWVVLDKDEPLVYIKNCLEVQDFDTLIQTDKYPPT